MVGYGEGLIRGALARRAVTAVWRNGVVFAALHLVRLPARRHGRVVAPGTTPPRARPYVVPTDPRPISWSRGAIPSRNALHESCSDGPGARRRPLVFAGIEESEFHFTRPAPAPARQSKGFDARDMRPPRSSGDVPHLGDANLASGAPCIPSRRNAGARVARRLLFRARSNDSRGAVSPSGLALASPHRRRSVRAPAVLATRRRRCQQFRHRARRRAQAPGAPGHGKTTQGGHRRRRPARSKGRLASETSDDLRPDGGLTGWPGPNRRPLRGVVT